MIVHSIRNESDHISLVVEWSEWEGAPMDAYLRTYGLGAAAGFAHKEVTVSFIVDTVDNPDGSGHSTIHAYHA